jgi:CubicO group peptidase (beta-lactamase class C family)
MTARLILRQVLLLLACAHLPAAALAQQDVPIDSQAVRQGAAALPQLHSLIVSWRGDVVVEHYARGAGPDRPTNIKSASKSLISALVGIAIERGLIDGLATPLITYFPELARDTDPRKPLITVEQLLTMQTGLQSTSGANYGAWVRSRNWVRDALARPLVSAPGTAMEYSTGTSHLLSAILTRVSGTSTWQFAQEALARPLGFSLARWTRDPQGIYFGGNEMLMTPRQMLALGELYLRRGRAGDRQVVPAAWVDQSCEPRTRSRYDPERLYGYGWWIRDIGGQQACFAWGFGGQYIMVFHDLDLVVTATSSTGISDERHGHRRALFALIAAQVVEPLAGRAAAQVD